MKRSVVPWSWKPLESSRASLSFSGNRLHSRLFFGLRQSPTLPTTGPAAYRPPRKLLNRGRGDLWFGAGAGVLVLAGHGYLRGHAAGKDKLGRLAVLIRAVARAFNS